MDTTENVIYLAGGCFWGMEQLMQSIPGVIDAEKVMPTAPARRMPITRPSARRDRLSGRRCAKAAIADAKDVLMKKGATLSECVF